MWKTRVGSHLYQEGRPTAPTPFTLQAFIPKDQHSRPLIPGRVCREVHGSLTPLSSLVYVLTQHLCVHKSCVFSEARELGEGRGGAEGSPLSRLKQRGPCTGWFYVST